jgi:hypothetical protein
LIVATPADVNSVNSCVNIAKTSLDNLKSSLGPIDAAQQQELNKMELVLRKLSNSATAAITETVLTKGVNKELVESADFQKNRKKASNKAENKISDARVLSLEMMDEAIRLKAEKAKANEEKLARPKRSKAITKEWKSLYNQTLIQLRKWGPEMLQEVEDELDLGHRLIFGKKSSPSKASLSKASKTPKARKKNAPPQALLASPPIALPLLDFPDFPILPRPPIKARSTNLLPASPTSPSIPSPSKQQSPVKPKRRRARKEKEREVVVEAIEIPEVQTIGGRRSRRWLFHDEVLARALANQRT